MLEKLLSEVTLANILIRFGFNLLVLTILVYFIYYKHSKKEEYLFSFYLIGVVIFLICALLKTVDIQLGLALGLFAVFAILRFRTVNYTVKDMTYIFAVIGVSVINSQANIPPPVIGAVVINSLIIIIAWLLELYTRKRTLTSFIIQYKNLNLLKPEARQDLLRELSVLTGYDIRNVVIKEMNIEKGSAELEVFFREQPT
ncbi:MAG TPA: DUF4956 domain-containing protein [Bacteroidales bacterium]|nr:DUF4956 domain-containing protein [Bacteroidales bacterium]HOK75902.1 DUF4956 domain-containing protein [Bacteroidales bacterium]HOM41299.1 DUF4956 domain-containing protein [Bacteroidales bacterium]HOU30377.1 DUF4956 domain-containing protein [Bacteroidales bacterium]HPP93732.1 DUF4956 domain-containing protein [Bacteroidales bacterium]